MCLGIHVSVYPCVHVSVDQCTNVLMHVSICLVYLFCDMRDPSVQERERERERDGLRGSEKKKKKYNIKKKTKKRGIERERERETERSRESWRRESESDRIPIEHLLPVRCLSKQGRSGPGMTVSCDMLPLTSGCVVTSVSLPVRGLGPFGV